MQDAIDYTPAVRLIHIHRKCKGLKATDCPKLFFGVYYLPF